MANGWSTSWRPKWFCWGDGRILKILDVSISSFCKKNTMNIHRFMVSTRIYIKLRDPNLSLPKTLLLSTAGCITQTFTILWLIIVILCSMTQKYERIFYQKATRNSEEAVQLLSITDHGEYTAFAALALCWTQTNPRFQKPSQNGLAHSTWLFPFITLPYYPRAKELLTLVVKHTSWKQGTSTWNWGSCLEEMKIEQNLNCFSANSKIDFLNYLSTCVHQGLCLTDFVENQGTKQRENIYSYIVFLV